MSTPKAGNAITENTSPIRITITLSGEVKETSVTLENDFTLSHLLNQITLTKKASISGMNLEAILYDGMHIYIPSKEALISLNESSKEELMTIKGIGEKTAQRIIEYRQQQPFYFMEELMAIKGIGQKKYQNYREYLCLSFS